jgi:two-component system, OmpR family, sensor histidine kinase BaeS
MPVRLRTRLSLNFLLVLLIGMGLAAGFTWLAVGKLYLDTQRNNLLAQVSLTAEALRGEDLTALSTEPYSQTANISPGIHTHLLDQNNAVVLSLPLADSQPLQEVPFGESDRLGSGTALLSRTEIQSALHGTAATAVRWIHLEGDHRILYASAPVYSTAGKISGIVVMATPLPSNGLPGSVTGTLAGIVLLAALAAFGVAIFLSRRISRPIESIVQAADKVAAGKLDEQVQPDRTIQELESLGQSFNAMTASLRQADQSKNAFIADVTHELRTPLTVIKGTLETLEDGAMDDLQGRGPLLASMQQESERLIRLVNDLLILSRSDAGVLKINLQNLDIAELARIRCQTLTPFAHKHSVELQITAGPDPWVNGDPDRLAQVLDNLLDNAIRHSPAGSVVTIQINPHGHEVECSVVDRGCGIPAEHLPFVFERFYRAESARDRHSGGSGLGLAIVRALVLLQRGRVTAESKVGEGTIIRFWLPVATELPAV